MLKQAIFIMECSRIFSLPTTLFSWLVIFVYSISEDGNVLFGLTALIGLIFAHLGTNLIDDYFDYKSLIKRVDFDKAEYLKNSQKTKCRYLISGAMKESQLLSISATYFTIALFIGLFLYLKCGIGVLYFALVGALISIMYPFLSRICLSELAVSLAYGPALFGGVYYVMTGLYSKEVFILSIPTMLVTTILLYIHTIMDYKFDLAEGKATLANRFKEQLDSLVVLKVLSVLAYVSLVLLCIFDILDWQVFVVYLTIPLAIDLYKSLKNYIKEPDKSPARRWYHFPMEKLPDFEKQGEASFMFRMLQTRNLMMYFSSLLVLSMLLCLYL